LFTLIAGLIFLFGSFAHPYAQTTLYDNEPAGSDKWQRYGFMNGNRVSFKFFNHSMLSDWPATDGSEWPIGSQCKMTDGIAIMIGAKLILDGNGNILEPGQVGSDTLYFCQTRYRENQDSDPVTGTIWGFAPVPGYLNPEQSTPALSDNSNSWPIGGWPDQPSWVDSEGNSEWNGHFGRGKMNADLECYFVVNDALDQEYVDTYLPRAGKSITDTLGNVMPWGGLGLRVGVRGFQWANPLAKDIIFWHYDCTNLSDNEIYESTLGLWIDNNISDANDDEIGVYIAPPINMAYAFDENGVGTGGVAVGVIGTAYLESPGIPRDGKDNDVDGIIDEKRDNDGGVFTTDSLEGPEGTRVDPTLFQQFYGYAPKAHWTGDEDMDWRGYEDVNGNGKWDSDEPYNDDLGTDGVGPEDDNYYGPDNDGTECNGIPDQGEPNFGRTDKDESDQIGLTAFQMFPVPPPKIGKWFMHDETMWGVFTGGLIPNSSSGNLVQVNASGPFPIRKYQTERISMAIIMALDKPYTNVDDPQVPKLLTKKFTVQNIYNNDYQFAKPPEKPTVRAFAGDGRVILSWDDRAESSKDSYLGYIEDFEGYKIYKSTEPNFEEVMTITDGRGSPLYKTPIAQFDLDNEIEGYSNYPVDGTAFWLGSNTGIQHYYIDEDVDNGRTYYYAVVAYDWGFGEPYNLPPSENTVILKVDDHYNILKQDKNVAVVTPYSKASGFIPGDLEYIPQDERAATGDIISYEILNPLDLKTNHKYSVKFKSIYYNEYPPNTFEYINTHYCLFDHTSEPFDTLIYWTPLKEEPVDTVISNIVDGFQLTMRLNNVSHYSDSRYEVPGNGWLIGDGDVEVSTTVNTARTPWDYDLIFTSGNSYTTPETPSNFKGYPTFREMEVPFYALNLNVKGEDGEPDTAAVVAVDYDKNGEFDLAIDYLLIGELYEYRTNRFKYVEGFQVKFDSTDTGINLPEAGDIYQIRQFRPFLETDSISFQVKPNVDLDKNLAKNEMDNIFVTPNPYIVTNVMEPDMRQGLNQQRKLLFNHLPAQCTIRIYTISGKLVDVIEVNNPVANGSYHWDMLTKEDNDIGFGVYLYHVDSPGIGTKIGKFAVIK